MPRSDHFPPWQSRLLSHAVDLDMRVDATKLNSTDTLQTGSLVNGVLILKRKLALRSLCVEEQRAATKKRWSSSIREWRTGS
ncbi:MAG: hypothetical protein R3E58_08785 [Phycisphaerae bacterium]